MYCVIEEHFWNLPSRTICRRCHQTSQQQQQTIQSLQAEIRRGSATLSQLIRSYERTLGTTVIEDPTEIIALAYYVEIIDEMNQTLSSLRPSQPPHQN